MKKQVTLFIFSILFVGALSAQSAKSLFFELGGPGLASINFDTRFGNREDGLGGRVGIGGFKVEETSAIFVPIGINFLLGKDSRNYFEIGGGITPTFISDDLIDDDGNFTGTFGHLVFGYRLQPLNGGFTFRAFMCPVFGEGGFIPYYAGVSFGYKFSRSGSK
jgi:hypothetical protein